MTLSAELLRQFSEVTAPVKSTGSEYTVYGTIDSIDDVTHQVMVRLDGAAPDQLTPVSYAANVNVGDRVLILFKNRQATITGNLTSPNGEPAGYRTLVANVNNHIQRSDIHKTVSELIDVFWPIGSVYIQFGTNLDTPDVLFGGTWDSILIQADGQAANSMQYHMWVRTA